MKTKILSILLLVVFLLPSAGWSERKVTMNGPFKIREHSIRSSQIRGYTLNVILKSFSRKPVKGVLHAQCVDERGHIIHGAHALVNAGEPIVRNQSVLVKVPIPSHIKQQTETYRLTFKRW